MSQEFKKEFYVQGMHCAACELLIENELCNLNGVKKVRASLVTNKVYVEAEQEINALELTNLVQEYGYKITENNPDVVKPNSLELAKSFIVAVLFFTTFLLLQKLGILNLGFINGEITLPFIFGIGVIASLSTCMAVVGGLVLSLSSNYAKGNQTTPMLAFHISRLVGFFLLGGLIGLIGSAFVLTPEVAFVINIILFVVMLIMAVNLLDVFNSAKVLQLRMPKFVSKKALKIANTNNFLAPALLGVATFFLPCGFTQSMQLYALTNGSFVNGAIIMLVFALGTFPVLALISFASNKFSKGLQSGLFFKTAGFIIIFFAIFNLLGSMAALGIIDSVFN